MENILGENLKNMREKRYMSQPELADKMGMTQQAISNWEKGKTTPSTEKIEKLSKILNCNPFDLINNVEMDVDSLIEIEQARARNELDHIVELSKDEKLLIESYRNSNQYGRLIAYQALLENKDTTNYTDLLKEDKDGN